MKPLFRELVRAGLLGQSPVIRPILDRVGLPEPRLGGWGVDWVEPNTNGTLYRPADEGGRVAAIFRVDYEGALVDLCAVSLETRAIRVRRGLCALLGEERLRPSTASAGRSPSSPRPVLRRLRDVAADPRPLTPAPFRPAKGEPRCTNHPSRRHTIT